tara:strand:+ start:735 stop:1079 length:345 start_codon:yes stop_codon:yes gene_type:complete
MDSKQRFTGDEAYYQMEDNFLEELESLPPLYGAAIIMQLDKLASDMYDENKIQKPTKKIGMVAGVVPLKDALFFKVEYLNSKSMHPLFYKFKIITSDDYLDYLNLNKAIKHEKE